MSDIFFSDDFTQIIYQNVINDLFPILRKDHKDLLFEHVTMIIQTVAMCFSFDKNNRSLYENQFIQNNYRDLKGLLLLLLPFIDESFAAMSEIKSLDDIYIKKKDKSKADLNKEQPRYTYSNIQYNRCIRNKNNIEEKHFHMDHLTHNTRLLINSIQEISHKMYVNWIDIIPISNYDFHESELYKSTKLMIDTHDITSNNDNYGIQRSELHVSAIYNTLSKYLFDDIKDIKWLMYDAEDTLDKTYILTINALFNIQDTIIQGSDWSNLTDVQISNFNVKWNNIILNVDNNRSIGTYTSNILILFVKTIAVFFQRNYNIEKAMKDGYLKFKKIEDEDIEIEEKHIREQKIEDMIQSIKSIPIEHLYMFIKNAIDKFKATWFGKKYITYDNKLNKYELLEKPINYSNNEIGIPIKLIYNFAKSVSHIQDGKNYIQFPRLWKSLAGSHKITILDRLNNKATDKWFNVSNILKNVYGAHPQDIAIHQKILTDKMYRILPWLVFDILTMNGILSQFVPQPSITNTKLLPSEYNQKNNKISELIGKKIINDMNGNVRKKWEESYYFLTNNKFKNMNKPIYQDKKTKLKVEKSYLKQITENFKDIGAWNTTYAMDWISQIGFFHRYINNRVMFVTGSTGVGKSTQIPKLLLYALKMIDYNTQGKIVCTQPRQAPTSGNAKIVSIQMGVPIEKYNSKFNKQLPTNDFYLQYKFKGGSHIKKTNGLMLKIVTDGSLYQELKSSPILKQSKMNDKNEIEYKQQNMYDIVIVDEAHEHNTNMDLILTMMKYAVHYNNSIKLIIVSATMDQDEPIYRRYYRNINDNKIFPYSAYLDRLKLDRINVDRRIHISPPGETTRFKIKDNYVENGNPEQIVLDIIKTTSDGDILLFKAGVSGISKAIKYLNPLLPQDTIALPFHSKMSDEKKEFVQGIQNNKYDLVIPKIINYDEDYDEDTITKVSKGTYKRIIIVATNIAEASITVGSLRFVIEAGTQKTNTYNYKFRNSVLELDHISESSRLQRRGRVGRVADGTVYYLYKIGAKEYIKTAYGIAISDIGNSMFELMRTLSSEKTLSDHLQVMDKQNKILDGEYKLINNGYPGFQNHYDYENNVTPNEYFETGYSETTIEDAEGGFYVIHPEEREIIRNIVGDIIGLVNPYNENIQFHSNYKKLMLNDKQKYKDRNLEKSSIVSFKMKKFFDILKEKLAIYSIESGDNMGTNKTEYGRKLFKLKEKLEFDNTADVITYLYSRVYKSDDKVLSAIVLKNSIDDSIKNILSQFMFRDKMQPQIELGKSLYGNNDGDAKSLAIIATKIITFFNENIFDLTKIYNKQINKRKLQKLASDLNELKSDYNRNKHTGDFERINYETAKLFIELDNTGKLVNKNTLTEKEIESLIIKDFYKKMLIIKINDSESIIKKFAKSNKLNHKTIIKFMTNYITIVNKMYLVQNKLEDDDAIIDTVTAEIGWFDDRIKPVDEFLNKPIIMPFLHGYGFNVALNIIQTDKYISSSNPTEPMNVRSISKIGKFSETFLKDHSQGNYILYLSITQDKLSLINRVNPRMVQSTVPFIYSPENINNHNTDNLNAKIIEYLQTKEIDPYDTGLKYQFIGSYLKTIDKNKSDMLNNYRTLPYTDLLYLEKEKNIDDDKKKEYKEKREYIEKFVDDTLKKNNDLLKK
jgi:hypothetical protein